MNCPPSLYNIPAHHYITLLNTKTTYEFNRYQHTTVQQYIYHFNTILCTPSQYDYCHHLASQKRGPHTKLTPHHLITPTTSPLHHFNTTQQHISFPFSHIVLFLPLFIDNRVRQSGPSTILPSSLGLNGFSVTLQSSSIPLCS